MNEEEELLDELEEVEENEDQQAEGEDAPEEVADDVESLEEEPSDAELEEAIYSIKVPIGDDEYEENEINVNDLPTILGNARKLVIENEQLRRVYNETSYKAELADYVAKDAFLNQLIQYKLQGANPREILEKTYAYMDENNLFEQPEEQQTQQENAEVKQMRERLEAMERERAEERSRSIEASNYQNMASVFDELGYEVDGDEATLTKVGREANKVAIEVLTELYGEKTAKQYLRTNSLPKRLMREIWNETAARMPEVIGKKGASKGKAAVTKKEPQSSVALVKKVTSAKQPLRQAAGKSGEDLTKKTGRPSETSRGTTERERANLYRKMGLL